MGRRILTGRYAPDNRIVTREPAGIIETPRGNGLTELTKEELDVVCIIPRPIRKKRKSALHKLAIMASAVILPVLFVAFADVLAITPGMFFGSLGVCFGWPLFVGLANYID